LAIDVFGVVVSSGFKANLAYLFFAIMSRILYNNHMSENGPRFDRDAGVKVKFTDVPGHERYKHVVGVGKQLFAGSALLDATRPVTKQDVQLIHDFHKTVSPKNEDNPWRLTRENRSLAAGEIADPSSFGNWEDPAGALEHMNLASQAATIVVNELKANSKSENMSEWARKARAKIDNLDPNHASAAAALHDEGREVTHLLFTNDRIGNQLLKKIGVREDIHKVLPDEQVMQVPLDERMDKYIQKMDAEAVIIRIADEFGKRNGATNRTLHPEDFDSSKMQGWAETFKNRPFSGRPSDQWARDNIDLHVANVDRYFQALDMWVQGVSGLTLSDLAQKIDDQLSPTLPPVTPKA